MKILVLNGSPKGQKSDTIHITNAFLDGIKSVKECKIEVINVIDKKINYCTGCFTCKKNGGTCVFNDDMREILQKMLASEVLLFSFPLYCYGMPAPLKALLDRTMPLSTLAMEKHRDGYAHTAQADYSHLKYVMICGCGFPDGNFDAMTMQFKLMFPIANTFITVPESPLFGVPEADAVTVPFLEKVKAAGMEYANNFSLSEKTIAELKTPMIPIDAYASIANGHNSGN